MSERKKVGAIATIFSILFCVLAILFGVVAGVVAAFRYTISPDMMKKYIKEVDLGEVVLGDKRETVQTVSEFVYENIPQEVRARLEFTLSQTQKLIEGSYVKEFVDKKVEDFINDLYYQTGEGKITPEEVVECIRRCDEEIYSLTGHKISENDLTLIQESFEKSGIFENITVDTIREEIPALSMLFKVISYETAAVFAGLSILMLLIVALLNRFRVRSLVYIGSVFLCTGGIFVAFSVTVNEFSEILRGNLNFELPLLNVPAAVLHKGFLSGGLSALGIGLCCIAIAIVYIMMKKANLKKFEKI